MTLRPLEPPMTDTAMLDALRAALNAEITASIELEAIDDDTSPNGYSFKIAVMVDGFGEHHDDPAAAAVDLSRRIDEAIAERG